MGKTVLGSDTERQVACLKREQNDQLSAGPWGHSVYTQSEEQSSGAMRT